MPPFDSTQLRALREAHGLSVDQVATALGRSRETVTELEDGVTVPCMQTLAALADLLGYELLDGDVVSAVLTDPRTTDLGPDVDQWLAEEYGAMGEMTDEQARSTSAAMFPAT